jgi:uncharacterized protein (TIGR02231 family)
MTNPGKAIVADLPVREVTLMEDRARVTRRGTVRLPAGVSTVRVDGVALVAADKTLQGRVRKGPEGSSVVSSRLQREHREVRTLDPSDRAARTKAIHDLQKECTRLQNRSTWCEHAKGKLEELEGRTIQEIGVDVSWNRADRAAWEKVLGAIRERQEALLAERARIHADVRKLQEDIDRARREVSALDAVTEEYSCRIEAVVDARGGGDLEVEFEYVAPGACWRPCHTVTLSRTPEGPRVAIQAEGCVWQLTGEAWTDVQLYFSTQRPSLGVEPPELDEDLLTAQKKPDKVVVEVREQEVRTAGLGQAREAAEMPGIDDGGEALNLKGSAPATVASDGRPYRAVMFRVTVPAETSLVCMPELAPCGILQSVQANASKAPLLAGPADLICESGPVGRTTMPFAAPGEKFKLGWGPDSEIRVSRWREDESIPDKMLSTWTEERPGSGFA